MTEPFDPYAENPALAEYKAAQEKEWGEWVAAQDYYVGVALAARRGDAIPTDNVKKHKLDEQGIVVKRNSKEGRAITGEPEPETVKPAKATGGSK
jgi:hypothetical protein